MRVPEVFMVFFAIGILVAQVSAAFAIVYVGARLAIRHERRASE